MVAGDEDKNTQCTLCWWETIDGSNISVIRTYPRFSHRPNATRLGLIGENRGPVTDCQSVSCICYLSANSFRSLKSCQPFRAREMRQHFVDGCKHYCRPLFFGVFFLSHRGCLSLPAANNFMVNTYVLMHANYLEYCKLLLHLLSLFFFFAII